MSGVDPTFSFLMGVHVPEEKEGQGDVDSDKRPGSSRSSLQGSLLRKKNMRSFHKVRYLWDSRYRSYL